MPSGPKRMNLASRAVSSSSAWSDGVKVALVLRRSTKQTSSSSKRVLYLSAAMSSFVCSANPFGNLPAGIVRSSVDFGRPGVFSSVSRVEGEHKSRGHSAPPSHVKALSGTLEPFVALHIDTLSEPNTSVK